MVKWWWFDQRYFQKSTNVSGKHLCQCQIPIINEQILCFGLPICSTISYRAQLWLRGQNLELKSRLACRVHIENHRVVKGQYNKQLAVGLVLEKEVQEKTLHDINAQTDKQWLSCNCLIYRYECTDQYKPKWMVYSSWHKCVWPVWMYNFSFLSFCKGHDNHM